MKAQVLDQLRDTVRRQPARLTQLHAQVRDTGNNWTTEQLRLLLETYTGFKLSDAASADPEISLGEVTSEEALLLAAREVLNAQAGRPIPIAQLIALLPSHLTTSPEQLRALAAKTNDLEIRGPMIRRKPGN